MLTEVSLKVEIVKNDYKFHENLFRNILDHLMPKIPQWLETFSKIILHLIINL